MKKIFYIGILFFAVACNSAGSSNNFVDTTTNIKKGNSPGSNVIEMDTIHVDTSGNGKSENGSNY